MKYFLSLTILILSYSISAQCRGFAKENCKSQLENYIPTGETANAELSPGDRYQFISTFYKGQSYRVVTCADETLGNIQFTIRNAKRQLYYDNHGDENRVFDFRVAATQQLIVSIVIPESKEEKTEAKEESKKNKESIVEGCVSAMIGFRL